jgi:DNA-binding NarL/FixJ family response regulator
MISEDPQAPFGLVAELAAVAEAAGARLRAETDADGDAARVAAELLMTAASAAMAAGHSLSEITRAEAQGQEDVRDGLRGDMLRSVERTGRRARETRMEHHQAIARAMRLGLSTREIAAAADVTHGTVRAISNRLAVDGADGPLVAASHGGDW